MPNLTFDQKMLSNFQEAIGKEWIITNGLGGYASSTVLGINTRKYHGILVAALDPPGNRNMFFAKMDEEVVVEGNIYPLGSNEFQNGIFPKGYLFLKEFSISYFPTFVYALHDIEIKKTIFMPYEKNAVILRYDIINRTDSDIQMRIYPLINCRHIHEVTDRWKTSLGFIQQQENKEVGVRFSTSQPVLMLKATTGHYHAGGRWIEKIYYREEAMRGESCLDDCYQLGFFEVDVKAYKNEAFAIVAVAGKNEAEARNFLGEIPVTAYDIDALLEREIKRRENLLTKFYEQNGRILKSDWLDWIILCTDLFIVKGINEAEKSVIAGYHWFEAWGRDTFIALPGLMLLTGRFKDAQEVFSAFKRYCKQGLIPNFVPDQIRMPAYNAVDASLWFVNAAFQYLKYTGDFKFVKESLWETFKTIIENYAKGTLFGIHVDDDGLLSHGSQLTWMDAAIDNQPLTPRNGKAVEIQALWYNALKIMEILAKNFKNGNEEGKYAEMAEKARKNFNEKFWNSEKNCLYDVINEQGKDQSFRPNQIIAVALDFTMLDNFKNEKIVDGVHRELFTPYGLRTLSKSDPKYIGMYAGNRMSRDKAYHNGTVWPWLLGPFTTSFLKTKGYATHRREYASKNFILPLFTRHVFEAGLGVVSEIFDGEPPHTPRGCIAQAWSVAEPFRAYVEDVMQIRPKYEAIVLKNLG